jgi:pimeloyl-ACP methyl ester carboxylesterase
MARLACSSCRGDWRTSGPFYSKGAVRMHYEEVGSGIPLLLIPGGGLNSTISFFTTSAPVNAMEAFKGEYRCITMDLRNANGGRSSGPLEIERPWDACADDQLSVMDHLGIAQFLVMRCIGGPFICKLLRRAPGRLVAAVLGSAERFAPGSTRPLLPEQYRRVGPGVVPSPTRHRHEHGRRLSDQRVPLPCRLRFHCDARFCARLSDAHSGPHPYAVAMEAALLAPRTPLPWQFATCAPPCKRIDLRQLSAKAA